MTLPTSTEETPGGSEGDRERGKEAAGKKESLTADPKANTRHGPPAPPSTQMEHFCRKILGE